MTVKYLFISLGEIFFKIVTDDTIKMTVKYLFISLGEIFFKIVTDDTIKLVVALFNFKYRLLG
jgi:hypothetical protein